MCLGILTLSQLVTRIADYKETGGLVTCSKEPAAGPWIVPGQLIHTALILRPSRHPEKKEA